MREKANVNWSLEKGSSVSWDCAQLAVLMDIRAELQRLNTLLHCGNAVDIPNILRRIDINTKKPARKRKK